MRTRERRNVVVEGVFVQIGENPSSLKAEDAGVITDKEHYIVVDNRQRTNFGGVFAAGDVTNFPVKQIGTAIGQVTTSAMEAFTYIRQCSSQIR